MPRGEGRWGFGFVISSFDSGASCPGSSRGRGHCVAFFTLSVSLPTSLPGSLILPRDPGNEVVSLQPAGLQMGTGELHGGGNTAVD